MYGEPLYWSCQLPLETRSSLISLSLILSTALVHHHDAGIIMTERYLIVGCETGGRVLSQKEDCLEEGDPGRTAIHGCPLAGLNVQNTGPRAV